MAITASHLYGLTLEKMLIDTAGQSLEAETHKTLMVTNSESPNFDTHDFRNDITAEVSGTGYTAGGVALTSTDLTISSGTLVFDAADSTWATSTITNARAAVHYFNVGSAATDQLVYLLNFGSDVSTTAGLFTIQYHATGIFIITY
jgi:hypothetical protein